MHWLLAAFSVSALALALSAAPVAAQQVVRYGPQGPMVLVGPDGRVLDQVPEYGNVQVYRNLRGQRVLVDDRGHLVATEVPLDAVRNRDLGSPDVVRLPRSGRNGSVERLDLPPPPGPGDGDTRSGNGVVPALNSPEIRSFPSQQRSTGPQQEPAAPARPTTAGKASKQQMAALEVLLDRSGASPGVIDGRMGDNVRKALDAYATMTGQRLDPSRHAFIERKLQDTGGPAFQDYRITASDAAGPYVASIPTDYAEKAQLTRLSYTSTAEMLAERFHMDEGYMKAINPGADFSVPGTVIKVAAPGKDKKAEVALIIVDKTASQVRAYTADGTLVAAYPATIGSTDLPSPSGTVKVDRIAPDPNYTYNPKINFKQGNNDHVLTVPPGPNGPVGNMWIALSKPTYGIHGTPEPSRIGKSNSHGCVRLTNWDAHELSKMIKPGVTVKFTGGSEG